MSIFHAFGVRGIVALAFLLPSAMSVAAETREPARIGILRASPPPAHYLDAFRQGMREHGHAEGRSYVVVPGWGASREHASRIPTLAEQLVARRVDVIVAVGTAAARAARRAGPSIPIVMASAGDPVRSKLVRSLAAPGGTITGLMSGSVELVPKRLEVLKELVPDLRRVATTTPLNLGATQGGAVSGITRLFVEAQRRAGEVLGIEFVEIVKAKDESWSAAFARIKAAGVGALSIGATPYLTAGDRKEIVAAALAHRLPTMFRTAEYVRLGGLASYATNRAAMYRRTAAYVARILKGARPADLPVERPTKFELVVNLKTARTLGIMIPPSILLRADEVIE